MGTTYICSKCSESISDTQNFIFNGEHNEYVCEKCCFKDNDTVEELSLTEVAKGIAVQIIDEIWKDEVVKVRGVCSLVAVNESSALSLWCTLKDQMYPQGTLLEDHLNDRGDCPS